MLDIFRSVCANILCIYRKKEKNHCHPNKSLFSLHIRSSSQKCAMLRFTLSEENIDLYHQIFFLSTIISARCFCASYRAFMFVFTENVYYNNNKIHSVTCVL